MCVCFGVERFHTIFLRPNKVQAAFANYRRLAGADVLRRAIYVYRMQRTIFESSLHC